MTYNFHLDLRSVSPCGGLLEPKFPKVTQGTLVSRIGRVPDDRCLTFEMRSSTTRKAR